MVVPRLYDIVNFVSFAAVEIDVMVGFGEQLALNSGIELISRQS